MKRFLAFCLALGVFVACNSFAADKAQLKKSKKTSNTVSKTQDKNSAAEHSNADDKSGAPYTKVHNWTRESNDKWTRESSDQWSRDKTK